MTSISQLNTLDGTLMANALTANGVSDPSSSSATGIDQTGTTGSTGSTSSTSDTSSSTSTDGLSALTNPQTFLTLLMSELENQDPTNPMSDSDLMDQTAELTQVEAIDSLSTNITQESTNMQNQTATSMLGAYVTGTDAAGNPVSGQVTSISINPTNGPSLTIGSSSVALSTVTQVSIEPPSS